jgi:hypothetical protein
MWTLMYVPYYKVVTAALSFDWLGGLMFVYG